MKLFKNTSKNKLYTLICILALASMLFRSINYLHFEQTSLLFIGIPALIAILIIRYTHTPKTLYGVVFRVITIFLLICSIFFGEGTACILFMAPIFYGVAALIIVIYKALKANKKANSFILLPLLLTIAQPNEFIKPKEIHSIENTIHLDKETSLNQLATSKKLDNNLPFFFDKLGFPKPISTTNNGINVGDIQNIQFLSKTKGIGVLSLKVVHYSKNKIVYKVVGDSTHINHWLTWKKIEVEITPLNKMETQIKWKSDFICDLGPSWYFEPLEKYAVSLMNEHLLNTYFK